MSKLKKVTAACLAVLTLLGSMPVLFGTGLYTAAVAAETEETPLFWDTSYSFEERAADLVSRLTLDEKISQLGNSVPAIPRLNIARYGYWNEGLHGVANTNKGNGEYATSYPYSIAMAATWDTDLIEEIMSASGDEARAYSNRGLRGLSYWCPTINMSRDPRWGRNHEGFGEDNYLTTQLGISYINGYQGVNDEDNTKGYLKVISTLKHYAANNSEYNRHDGSSSVQNQYIRDYFTRSFKGVVAGTDVNSVMSAYNMVNNIPSSGSYYLLDTLLRKTFGFDGYVVSDCGAIANVASVTDHHWKPTDHNLPDANGLYAGTDGFEAIDYSAYVGEDGHITYPGAAALCLTAGCDMDCGTTYPNNAKAAVKAGILSEDVIDRALVRIFTARMKTGEFDPAEEVVYRSDAYSWDNQIHSADKITLAEESSTQAIVMMKNDAPTGETTPILPLDKSKKNIVMVGELSTQNILGGYSGTPEDQYLSTPKQGIEKILGQEVTYIKASAGSNAYMANVSEIILHKTDGSKVTLTPKDVASYTGCELDGTSNFRYIQPGAVISFKQVYMKDTNRVEIKVAGDAKSLLGRIRVTYGDVNGGVLANINTVRTGSNTTYQSVEGFESNGSYDVRDIHLTFYSDETSVSFTEAQKTTIRNADAVIACIGGVNSAEGNDRVNISLWNSQHELVKQVATLNPRTVCHLQTVGVMEIGTFKDITPAILWTCNNGQAQGNALARVLFGEVSPSAKLPFTWYSYNSQLETIDDYDLASEDYAYGGWTYQYFTGDVDYPFGHGLTYTTFEYSDLRLDTTSVTPDSQIKATVKVENTGSVDAKEVVQLYVSSPKADGLNRPFKQLKAFDKVEIKAGETKTVELTLNLKDCYFWDEDLQKNVWDEGMYELFVGPSSNGDDANAQTATFTLAGTPKEAISVVQATPSAVVLNAAKPGKKATTDLAITMMDDTILTADSDKVTVTYTSNRPAVATVDGEGNVMAVGKGVATITVTAKLADGVEVTDSYAVAVKDDLSLDDIQVNGESIVGFNPDMTEYYYPVTGTTVPTVTFNDGGANATLKNATTIPGDTTITLTKGDETVVYTVHFLNRSEDYVVATFSQMERTYDSTTSGNGQLYADWKKADQITGSKTSVNFYEHNLSDLHFRATVTLEKPADGASDDAAFGVGYIKLRSVDNNGENNYGWDFNKIGLKLKTGVNYVDIPLSLANTNAKGTMDWTKVDRCIFVLPNTNNVDGKNVSYKMTLEDVRVVDTSLGGARDELWAAIQSNIDTSAYTPESTAAYRKAYDAALKLVLDEEATEAELKAAIAPLEAAKAELEPLTYIKETFTNFNKNYNSYNMPSNGIAKNETMWANWTKTDHAFMDVSDDRSKYALQLTLQFSTKTGPIPAGEAWNDFYVKFRSDMVGGVSNDPNGADNREHNYGWNFYASNLNKEDPLGNGAPVTFTSTDGGKTVKLSIPLDTPKTNSRGVMDWADVREIILVTTLKDSIKKDLPAVEENSYTMTITDTRVVDLSYVNEQKVTLQATADMKVTPAAEATAEDILAYNNAKAAAKAICEDAFATPQQVYDAQEALNAAIAVVTGEAGAVVDKEALNTAIRKAGRFDLTLYKPETVTPLETALAAAKAVYDKADATQVEVNVALANLEKAMDGLKLIYDPDPADVTVNFSAHNKTFTKVLDGKMFYANWQIGDGLSKDSATPAVGADISGSADNGANRNLYLQANLRFNALTEGIDPNAAFKQIGFRLRSGRVDGKEMAAKFYDIRPNMVELKADGSYDIVIPLSEIVKENIDWTDLREMNIICYVTDDFVVPDAGGTEPTHPSVSMTLSDVRIAKLAEEEEPVADKAALNAAITAAEKVDLSGYTDASVKTFTDALNAAKAVAADETADQTAVDNAKALLEAAQKGLAAKPVEPEVTPGDINGNGSVTAEDALLALQIATNKVTPTAEQTKAADVDKNGEITANDALLILQFATKKINTL